MKSFLPITFFIFFSLFSYGYQSEIDSLKTELSRTKIDSVKVELYNQIATKFISINYDSILPYSQKAFNLSSKIQFPKGKATALRNQSIYYFYAGKPIESKTKIEEAISIFKKLNHWSLLAKCYQTYGLLLKNYGENSKAIEKYNKALSIYQKINDENGVAKNLINLGNIYQKQGDYDKALDVFSRASVLNKNLNDKNLKASILTGQGLIAENQGKLDLASEKFSESLEIFKKLDDKRLVSGMYNNLGNISRKQGKYLESITYFEGALEVSKELNNPRLQGIFLNNLANAYLDIDDENEAAALYKEAITIIKDIDKPTYASLLLNLAIIQSDQENYKASLQSLDSSLTIYKEQGNKIYIASNLMNIAHNYFKLENNSKAKKYYVQAKSLAEELEDQYSSVFIYRGLGEVYLDENQLDSAYYYTSKAYSTSKDIKALPEESSAVKLLYDISKSSNKTKDALKYLEVYNSLKDSLFDNEKSKALGKLEAELGFKKIKEQLELEKQNQRLENEVKVNQRENFIIVLSTAFIVLIIVLLFLLKIKKDKTKANRLLDKKNKEIERKNIKLNESNIQKNKLFSIISHDLRSPVNSLSQIFDLYTSGQITDEEFKEWLPEISKNLNSTRSLIDNLLKWASESLNKSQVEKKKIDLHSEVEEMKVFFASSLKKKNITINNKVSEEFQIYMDVNALKLVIRNLISNAIKFCNSGDEIRLSATTQGNYSRVCIQDTGVGMSKDTSRRLFNNSSIISSVGTEKEEGNGIGTTLCRTFVEENGGTIWVDYTEEAVGTRICFEVPVQS